MCLGDDSSRIAMLKLNSEAQQWKLVLLDRLLVTVGPCRRQLRGRSRRADARSSSINWLKSELPKPKALAPVRCHRDRHCPTWASSNFHCPTTTEVQNLAFRHLIAIPRFHPMRKAPITGILQRSTCLILGSTCYLG
jgi:hypothetical protein